jgi:rhomboid protease GluP
MLFDAPPAEPDPDPDDEHADRRDALAPLQEMLRARLPRTIVTPAILAAIGAVFLVMVAASGEVSFSSPTLYHWGAQFGPAIARGQWWRLLTAMWLHASPLHAALNGLFLWRFGAYVERLLGPIVFLIVYLLGGVIASVVSLQFQASNGLSVGASGALFGLVGVLLMVAMTSRGSGVLGDMLAELRPNLILVVVVNLMLGFLVQGIDNAAHIGGLAGGLALGWLVGRHSLEAIPSPRVTLIPIVLTAGLATAAVLSLGRRQDILTERVHERVPVASRDVARTVGGR